MFLNWGLFFEEAVYYYCILLGEKCIPEVICYDYKNPSMKFVLDEKNFKLLYNFDYINILVSRWFLRLPNNISNKYKKELPITDENKVLVFAARVASFIVSSHPKYSKTKGFYLSKSNPNKEKELVVKCLDNIIEAKSKVYGRIRIKYQEIESKYELEEKDKEDTKKRCS